MTAGACASAVVVPENGGEFKMGGSVDGAFAFGLDAIIRGAG